MEKLHFKTTQEFESAFKNSNIEVTNAIVKAIEEAIASRKRSADLFQITFDGVEMLYEIALPQSQWTHALQSCLDLYHAQNKTDECIDTWKLLELSKTL